MSFLEMFINGKEGEVKQNLEVLKKSKEVSFYDSETKTRFLGIEPYDKPSVSGLRAIGKATKLNNLIQQLPVAATIVQNEATKGLYKVVLPENAVGTLMKYKDGGFGTPFVGPGGSIVDHAQIFPVDALNISPLLIFTAMSQVTGQYFMARIDESLEKISKNVKTIIDLMYDEKESDCFATYNFHEYVKNNMRFILSNDLLKISTLTNIQLNNNKMNSNILFYSKSIRRELKNIEEVLSKSSMTKKRLELMGEVSEKVSMFIIQQHLCYELFCVGKVFEMQISEIYDTEYCNNITRELEQLSKTINSDISSLTCKSKSVMLEIIKEAKVKGNDAVSKFNNEMEKLDKNQMNFINNSRQFIKSLNTFNSEIRRSKEFIISENEIYVG